MSKDDWRVADLLPHTGTAVLLDEVLAWTETGLLAGVMIRRGSPFHQDNGVPAHVGIEYMAQACGAFSGIRALRDGQPPRMGFILGTRRYLATRAWFVDGEQLAVAVDLVYRDNEVGVFDCVIRSNDTVIAKAQLIVSEQSNVAELLGRQDGVRDA